MTSRVISYTFRGDFGNLRSGLVGAGKETDATKRKLQELEAQTKKVNANITGFKGGLASAFGVSGAQSAGAIGFAAAAGIAAVVSTTAKFDQAMSAVQAATHETAGNMDDLRKAAIKAGADTVFSATESANAIEAMAKAGVSTKDILSGGLTGALNLASAGTIDVAQAADIAATTLNQFNLSGDQTSHVADVLSAAAGKAQGEVTDMAQALKYVGPVAAQMGISLEETTGTIAELASQGILADQAGTSLRGMLTSLTSPSKIASKTMQDLGINVYDAQGKFVGFQGIAGQLQSTMSGLTAAERDQALGRIFGNEQITAARILYAGGADDVAKWTSAVNDSGYAADTAAIKLDNLSGDFEQLKGSIESALITSGEGQQSSLRQLTQSATEAINLASGSGIEGLGQKFFNTASGLDSVTGSMKVWSHWLGIGGDEAKKSKGPTEDYAKAIGTIAPVSDDGAAAIADMVKSMTDQRKAALGAFDAVTQYGAALDAARKQAKASNAGISASTKAGRDNRKALSDLAAAWNNQSDAVRNNTGKFRQARKDFIDTATAMGVPISQAKRLARQLLEIPDSKAVTVTVEASSAQATLASIIRQAQSVPRTIRTDYIVNQVNAANKGRGLPKASGGPIVGPGTGTSDDVPIWASNGEFMMKTAAVQKYGVAMMDSINNLSFAKGGLIGGYANGGRVSAAYGAAAAFGIDIDKNDHLKRRLNLFQQALDNATKALDDETQARDSLISTVTGNLTGDLFSASGKSAFSSAYAAGSPGDVNARLRQQIADAKQQTQLEIELHRRGLSGPALQSLISEGGIGALRQFASGSNSQLSDYQSLYNERTRAVAGTAGTAASVLGLTNAQNRYAHQVDILTAEVKALRKQLDHNHKDSKADRARNAKATADHINHGAGKARSKAR